jgi:hypothetical protein
MANTNDPRENKSFIFASISNTRLDFTELNKRNEEISKILREDCKVLCFSDDNPNYFGYEMSRMWAYYGGNHQGVCLEFDKTEFIIENKTVINADYLKNINYFQFDIKKEYRHKTVDHVEMEKLGKEKYIKEVFRPANLEHLYFTKNKEWESEAEIRLIHFSSNPADEFCSIKKSLKNIYLGVDFDDNNLPTIIDFCPHIDIYKLIFNEVRMGTELIYKGSMK